MIPSLQHHEFSLPGADTMIYIYLPLVPILFWMLNRNRNACSRTWVEQLRLTGLALRNAMKSERSIWVVCILSAVVWKACFEFYPLPDPFDAANATRTEMTTVFVGTALFLVWFVGGIVAGVKTLSGAASNLDCN